MDKRPAWDWSIPIETFEFIAAGVKAITHHWEMTGADTSKDWVVLHTENGDFKASTYPSLHRDGVWKLFEFSPDHRGLLSLTWEGKKAQDRARAIYEFDKENAKEKAEFERLKAKFEQPK